ncbi:hypothetical protein [Enterococcus sp. BWR-S5]|uniref:hypothetical protein n=1 Tax=Enterococcus sp. BWR-S5 TaxID=2787714 RepID=UPI00192249CF|nr:hypothetical protein [Enterococcus sp. BWR-S5]MBL1226493.1 hypothetical protein [Enterococcus sp. BWR-S5]
MSRKTRFTEKDFSLGRWGDSVWLREAREEKFCTEIREFIPSPENPCEAQNAEYMMICHGLQPELTREELVKFAVDILYLTGSFPLKREVK